MSREDVIPQLFRQLMKKEGPPPETDNSILQKMVVVIDRSTALDTLNITKQTVGNQTWGDGSIWGGGQWQ